jgi:hypothetical protein
MSNKALTLISSLSNTYYGYMKDKSMATQMKVCFEITSHDSQEEKVL